jgi:HK97 family phage portal protein
VSKYMYNIINNMFKKTRKLDVKNYDNYYASLHFLNGYKSSDNNCNVQNKLSYQKNVIVYRAINLIATSAASVPWKLHSHKLGKMEEIHHHPILNLLHKPNNNMAGAEFFQHLLVNRMITGDAYIQLVLKNNITPIAMHLLRPDRVSREYNNLGNISSYVYQVGERKIKYKVDPTTGKSNIMHLKYFNPNDDYAGLSPLAASALSIEQYNEAASWNLSMLKNSARPSGALVVKQQSATNGYLDDEQMDQIRAQFQDAYGSSSNTGRPLLLQGGLEWQEMSLSPKDMDFIESKHSNARDIALSLGVPPQLLGIPGDSTYNNYQEARLALWEETIIPILDYLVDVLNNWLIPYFNKDLVLSYNIDEISALSARREKIWSRLEKSSFLTINEKRKIIGLSPIKGGDNL